MGNVSYQVPSIHPLYAIKSTDSNHTPGFTAACVSEAAHSVTITHAEAMAHTCIDFMLDASLLKDAKAYFSTHHPYNSNKV